ncbi:MAG: Gfo/Idh/MocA family oxidoreductase, partial [Bryobacteraceae bacterium]
MRRLLFLPLLCWALAAQEKPSYKVAIIGLVHAHVWGHLHTILEGKTVTLAGISEPNPELVDEAKKMGVDDALFFPDYSKMLDRTAPDIVWAFVENNRHLEIAKACAQRH